QSVVMINNATGQSYSLADGYFTVYMDNGVLKFAFTTDGISQLNIDDMTANDMMSFTITMQVKDDINQTSNIHTLLLNVQGQDGAPGTPPVLTITDDEKGENEVVFDQEGVFIEFTITDDEPGTEIISL